MMCLLETLGRALWCEPGVQNLVFHTAGTQWKWYAKKIPHTKQNNNALEKTKVGGFFAHSLGDGPYSISTPYIQGRGFIYYFIRYLYDYVILRK